VRVDRALLGAVRLRAVRQRGEALEVLLRRGGLRLAQHEELVLGRHPHVQAELGRARDHASEHVARRERDLLSVGPAVVAEHHGRVLEPRHHAQRSRVTDRDDVAEAALPRGPPVRVAIGRRLRVVIEVHHPQVARELNINGAVDAEASGGDALRAEDAVRVGAADDHRVDRTVGDPLEHVGRPGRARHVVLLVNGS
jgi:hypothetical protein